MKKAMLACILGSGLLGGCSLFETLPYGQGEDININGSYTGRVVGSGGESAVLDVEVAEKDLAVTATVKSRANGQTYLMTGTRSVYKSTPVSVNLVGYAGTGSCEGYSTKYVADVTFTEYERGSAHGYMNQYNCAGGQWQSDYDNSGKLELTRR